MALTAEQNRSMDRYLYKGGSSSGRIIGKNKQKEMETIEKGKSITEDILDGALKSIEDSHE